MTFAPFYIIKKTVFATFILVSIFLFIISFFDQQGWCIIHLTITVMNDEFLIHDVTFNHLSIIWSH